jgi:hypothetical protein
MKTSRWRPLPADVMGAARELTLRLRQLMDGAGLSLRRLAADDRVPYGMPALRRFFSGRELPPRELIDVIADRCGGDRELLSSTLDRAVVARDAGLPWAAKQAPRSRWSFRDRPGPIVAAFAGVVAVALIAATVVLFTGRSSSEPAGPSAPGSSLRSAAPAASRPPSPDPTAAQAAPAPPAARRPPRGYLAGPSETNGSLIRNGTFDRTVTSWWPVSDVRITADAGRLRANVRGGGAETWDRIVSAASFPLRSGRDYILTFDAAAGAGSTDRVTVQLDQQPYTAAISSDIELTTAMRRFSYRFTAGFTTDRAALNFELGGHVADHTIWLDNVVLVPA